MYNEKSLKQTPIHNIKCIFTTFILWFISIEQATGPMPHTSEVAYHQPPPQTLIFILRRDWLSDVDRTRLTLWLRPAAGNLQPSLLRAVATECTAHLTHVHAITSLLTYAGVHSKPHSCTHYKLIIHICKKYFSIKLR